jgi:hypothetical protein
VNGLRDPKPAPARPVAELDRGFAAMAPLLPPNGEIGYLEPHQDAGSEDAVRMRYVAQYALSPRVVVARVGSEFLIVPEGAAHPDGDSRLDGYFPVMSFPGGHRLFRRLNP